MSIPLLLSTRSHARASRAYAGRVVARCVVARRLRLRVNRNGELRRLCVLRAQFAAAESQSYAPGSPQMRRHLQKTSPCARRTPTRSIEMRLHESVSQPAFGCQQGKPKVTYCEVSVFEPSSNVLSFANKKPHVLGLSVVAECRSLFKIPQAAAFFNARLGEAPKNAQRRNATATQA